MASTLPIGIFGVGHLGKFHINNWKNIEGVTLAGFYDPNDAHARDVTGTYGLKRFSDPEALMDACEAIDIVTPTPSHYDICELGIRKGKHIFVEKPMTHTMEQAKQLLKLVKESNIKMQVGHVERFNPAFLSLQDTPMNPMFIEVHRLAQFNPRGTEVSVILDLMIHDIDIILSIVKSDVRTISASGVAVLTDTPDIANVRIEFNNGCVANLTSSRISLKKMRKMRLFQKDAYIGIDFLEKKSEIIKLQEDNSSEDALAFDLDTPYGTKTIAITTPPIPNVNAIKAELEAFRDAIILNQPIAVSELDGYRALDIAHQILDKINKNVLAH